jgi:hypothetical protein
MTDVNNIANIVKEMRRIYTLQLENKFTKQQWLIELSKLNNMVIEMQEDPFSLFDQISDSFLHYLIMEITLFSKSLERKNVFMKMFQYFTLSAMSSCVFSNLINAVFLQLIQAKVVLDVKKISLF